MSRTLLGCAAMAVLALPCRADQTSATPETLIRLNVSPAPAPKPALRYQLLPELKEMNPGNPIQNYMKCFMEQQRFFFDKEAFERREKLLAMPLKELPAQELQDYGGFALCQADRAARLDNPDWQILLKLKADGIGLLHPRRAADSGPWPPPSRCGSGPRSPWAASTTRSAPPRRCSPCRATWASTRRSSATWWASRSRTMAIGPLEEMLEQPGCPNLYWALTNLPNPLVPLDKGDGKASGCASVWVFRDLDDKRPDERGPDQEVHRVTWTSCSEMGSTSQQGEGVRAWLDARTKDEAVVGAARRRLVENGLPEERLLRFPADQVILLDEKREFEVRFDDLMKTIDLARLAGRGAGRPQSRRTRSRRCSPMPWCRP